MTPELSAAGYAQTQAKLADLRARLAALEARTGLRPVHREEARKSCERMISQYLREIKLYEARRRPDEAAGPPRGAGGRQPIEP